MDDRSHEPSPARSWAEAEEILRSTDAQSRGTTGRVTLVGAGPGDPELLTLKAVAALRAADVVLFDELVSPDVLAVIPPEAKKLNVGKRGYRPSCKQPDINALMVSLAQAGARVVRLKAGDPLIFGRAGEEITACVTAKIPVDIVPGITSAQGAAANLRVSLTHRDFARRLQYVTAHDRHGRLPDDVDWSALADATATTVIYMPKRTLAELTKLAINRGLPETTVAVAVANATRDEETVIWGTVGDIAERLDAAECSGPVLVLMGQAIGTAVDRPDVVAVEPSAPAGA